MLVTAEGPVGVKGEDGAFCENGDVGPELMNGFRLPALYAAKGLETVRGC